MSDYLALAGMLGWFVFGYTLGRRKSARSRGTDGDT